MASSTASLTLVLPARNFTLPSGFVVWPVKYLHTSNLAGHPQHFITRERERERERSIPIFELPCQKDNQDNDSY
jgi:hypothetical protein